MHRKRKKIPKGIDIRLGSFKSVMENGFNKKIRERSKEGISGKNSFNITKSKKAFIN